jgi:hypothetical protein
MSDTCMALPWINEKQIADRHPIIFHYTDYLNLRSIMASGGLYATPYSQTNDREEFLAARKIIAPLIADHTLSFLEKNHPHLVATIIAAGKDPKLISESDAQITFDSAIKTNVYKPYLTCFSFHKSEPHIDNGLLTMWRSYCSRNGGIAIGFDTKTLIQKSERLLREQCFDFLFLDEALYAPDSEELSKRIGECKEIIEIPARFLHAKIRGIEPKISVEALHKLLIMCACVKHPDFSDEREIRMVASISNIDDGKRAEVVMHGSRAILSISDCITQIMIGPSRDQDAIEAGVRHCLLSARREDIRVVRSETPYRNL